MTDRSKFYPVVDIGVQDLLLDAYNPRIRHGCDQPDCIVRITKDRETFLNLLKDIAINGLSPEHILISPTTEGGWVVRDGNRRVTALKLLSNPDLCQFDPQLFKIVQRIAEEMTSSVEEHIDCLACNDEEVISSYIKRKHTGENAGIGQVNWSSLLIALFNVHIGVTDQNRRSSQIILWAESKGLIVENEFPITTLTRALTTETLRLLGLAVNVDQLALVLPENQVYALVVRVINDIAAGRVHVKRDNSPGSIYTQEQAFQYVERIRIEMGPLVPVTNHEGEQSRNDGTSKPIFIDQENSLGTSSNVSNSSPIVSVVSSNGIGLGRPLGGSTNKPSWDRPCLFGSRKRAHQGFEVPANATKVLNIIADLRNLNPKETPIAVAMLLRALIEFSERHYRTTHNLRDRQKLADNIAACSEHMKSASLLSNDQHEVVRSHTRSESDMLSVKTLQMYIHRDDFHPSAQTLNTMWDEIGCFVRACWA